MLCHSIPGASNCTMCRLHTLCTWPLGSSATSHQVTQHPALHARFKSHIVHVKFAAMRQRAQLRSLLEIRFVTFHAMVPGLHARVSTCPFMQGFLNLHPRVQLLGHGGGRLSSSIKGTPHTRVTRCNLPLHASSSNRVQRVARHHELRTAGKRQSDSTDCILATSAYTQQQHSLTWQGICQIAGQLETRRRLSRVTTTQTTRTDAEQQPILCQQAERAPGTTLPALHVQSCWACLCVRPAPGSVSHCLPCATMCGAGTIRWPHTPAAPAPWHPARAATSWGPASLQGTAENIGSR